MCAFLSMTVRASGIVPKQAIKGRKHAIKIAVLAVVFVASVVGGNISLRFIPVSFNQAIGATTPFFTALLSLFIMRHKESTQTYMTLIPIVLGIMIASKAEPLFHPVGFVACFSATFARALKSVLQGLLLTSDNEKLDSLNLLMYMSPVALFVLVASANIMEPDAFGVFYQNCLDSPQFFFTLTLNCVLAFSVNLTNFLVTKCTSPLTLQVLGNAKGAVAVVVSIILFRNPVSGIGMVGYRIEPTTIAPCQPLHALLVNLPQQAVFLLSLRMRRLVTTWGAIRLFGTFATGVVLLNVAHEFAHGERETIAGAPKKDGSVEVLDVTDATVNLFVAFARAAAGLLLVQGSSEREGANSAPRKTTGSPQELCLASCWCVMLVRGAGAWCWCVMHTACTSHLSNALHPTKSDLQSLPDQDLTPGGTLQHVR